MGYITPEVAGKFPGYLSKSENLKFADVPNGLAAISKVPGAGWIQIFSWFAFCEIQQGYDADVKAEPGNVGWKPPLLVSADPETRKRRLNAEIANGRLAMMAIIGMFFQDGLTGSAWGDWALYEGSPLRGPRWLLQGRNQCLPRLVMCSYSSFWHAFGSQPVLISVFISACPL